MSDKPAFIRVVVESPYAGNVEGNLRYLHLVMLDCLQRGEAPFASHALYTQVLDDTKPDDRALGIGAGFAWGEVADKVIVYVDLGITDGMRAGIKRATERGQIVERRQISCLCGITYANHNSEGPIWPKPSLLCPGFRFAPGKKEPK